MLAMRKVTDKEKQDIHDEIFSATSAAMQAAGLGLDRGLLKLDQLLEATKPISCIKGKEADGGTVDFVDVPDNQTQVKALDILLTLGDHYPGKKIKAEVSIGLADLLLAEVDGSTTGLPSKRVAKGKGKVKKSQRS
jgi:hypothetical protein